MAVQTAGKGIQPSLFAGILCGSCPAAEFCSVRSSTDACGDAAEYPDIANALHPARAHATLPSEFRLRSVVWPELPLLPSGLVIGAHLLQTRQVAIRLKEALTPSTWRQLPLLRQSNIRGIAILTGSDRAIERLWLRSGTLGEELRANGVELVVAPGYSTWWDDPPMSALHAMARSAEIARILARSLPTVPTIVWRYQADLDRWAKWLSDTGAQAICIDMALRSAIEQRWALDGVAYLARALAEMGTAVPRLLALGLSTLERMKSMALAWTGPLSFLSQDPWWKANGGKCLHPNLSYERRGLDIQVRDLLEENASTFNLAVHALLPVWRSGCLQTRSAS